MSKPILIVRFPHDAQLDQLEAADKAINKKGINQDYHFLIVKDNSNNTGIVFECFNAPHTEIEFEELKNRVLALIRNN